MPLSFATPPGAPRAPGDLNLPDELRALPFLSAWAGSELHGFDSPLRLGGVFVESADVVLGLRSWNDAREGRLQGPGGAPIPYAVFEVEKLVRMLLGQSGLAFEVLASPVVFETHSSLAGAAFPARRIVKAAVTSGLLHHYRDVARAGLAHMIAAKGQGARPADVNQLVRAALTGKALMRAQVDFDLTRLLAEHAPPGFAELLAATQADDLTEPAWLDSFEHKMKGVLSALVPEDAALPSQPSDYDWLHDFVIAARLARLESRRADNPDPGGCA